MTRARPGAAKLIRQGKTALADHFVFMTRRLDAFDSISPDQGRSPAL
jgi:hypothetical protein